MGPPGLLIQLKAALEDVAWTQQCAGTTVAVDSFGWLHKAIIENEEDILLKDDVASSVAWMENRVDMMMLHGAKPLLVFDGRRLAGKWVAAAVRDMARVMAEQQVDRARDAARDAAQAASQTCVVP